MSDKVTNRKSRIMSLKFGTLRFLIPGAAAFGLLLNSGCGVLSRTRYEQDHVFSSALPQKSEISTHDETSSVRAQYPENSPSVSRAQYDPAQAQYQGVDDPASPAIEGVVKMKATTETDPSVDSRSGLDRLNSGDGGEFQFVSYLAESSGSSRSHNGTVFTPAEPRRDVDPREVPSNRMETIAASPDADLYPDEYLFDGGDRNAPAGYIDGQRSGFDSEDTVAKYQDHTGSARTSQSNRVAVYAPRFGSVRTVQGLQADIKVDRAAGARDTQSIGNIKTGNAAQESVHGTVLSGLDSRSRVDGMESSTPVMQAKRTDSPEQNRKIDDGREGRHYSSSNSMQRHQGFVLQQQIQNAMGWTRDQYPVLTASTANANAINTTFKVQQTVAVEDERRTKGNIHIVKLADHEMAQSGDTIAFTIRFENTGDFDVYDVSIVDNLTPRLQYVPGTARIDGEHPGEVIIEDNGEGSSVLTFKLDRELKGHDRGEITFEARVR